MIVDPDFLTHWKTQALKETLEDEAAPVYVIALWAHCQLRRTDRFEGISHGTFAKICRYPFKGDSGSFFEAMRDCGFVDIEGDTVVVHGWAEVNSKLFSNWQNGTLGGRPRNPQQTHEKPKNEKPELGTLDKEREDRKDKRESTDAPKSRPAADDLEWLAELRSDPAYKGIDVAREYAKSVRWCKENRRQPTRKFFINWLNKADRHLDVKFKPSSTTLKVLPERPPELTDEQIAKNKAVIADLVGGLHGKLNVREA